MEDWNYEMMQFFGDALGKALGIVEVPPEDYEFGPDAFALTDGGPVGIVIFDRPYKGVRPDSQVEVENASAARVDGKEGV
jgi:hypothetical protein